MSTLENEIRGYMETLKRILGPAEYCRRLNAWFDATGESTETVKLEKLAAALRSAVEKELN